MLLDSSRVLAERTRIEDSYFLLLAVLLVGCVASAAEPLPACFVDVPVYGPKGDRLAFKINAATPEGEKDTDLLTIREQEYRVVAREDRLYFRPSLIGKRRLTLELENGKGGKITTHVALMHCQQRMSVEFGGLSGLGTGDVAWSTASGRLTGCKLAGDWWIRAMPMFGAQENPIIHEGFIRLSDGAFWVISSMHGERHVFVVGRDKLPIKVFAVNVIEGGKNDLGVIDLTGLCPE